MICDNCASPRIAQINAKCSDLCFVDIGGTEHDGYVPRDMGIGGGDYLEIDLCLNCGHVQGEWPLARTTLERKAHKSAKAEFVPAPRNPKYTDYLEDLMRVCNLYGHMGVNTILPTLLGEDYDADRLIAGVQEIFRHEEYTPLGETIMDKMQDWEHYHLMKQAVNLVVPPEVDEEDDDDDDD